MVGLDDWPDIRRTIDDAVDEAELLPNRYQNMLDNRQMKRIVLYVEARTARGYVRGKNEHSYRKSQSSITQYQKRQD